jgi:hypothetical protein
VRFVLICQAQQVGLETYRTVHLLIYEPLERLIESNVKRDHEDFECTLQLGEHLSEVLQHVAEVAHLRVGRGKDRARMLPLVQTLGKSSAGLGKAPPSLRLPLSTGHEGFDETFETKKVLLESLEPAPPHWAVMCELEDWRHM